MSTEQILQQLRDENSALHHRLEEQERKTWDLDKRIFELKVLYEIAKETTTAQDICTMLKIFLSMTMGTFGISKGLIAIRNVERQWTIVTSRGVNLSSESLSSRNLQDFNILLDIKDTCLFQPESFESAPDFLITPLFDMLLNIPIRVWVPIISESEIIGAICVGEKISGEPFIVDNLNLLSIIASNCALNIRNARLFQETMEKERIQRENEELKKIDKKKSEFVNMVAHELRTPLTSISGFSELMIKKADTKPKETLVKYASIIFQESDRLRRIINDLLDLSRIKSGKVEMEMEPNNFKKVLENSLANIQVHADKKKISISSEIADVGLFSFDRDKMTQVLLNLLSNAVKYTREDGHVKVTVQLQNGMLNCHVSDSGVGIPKSDIEKIFEEFHRVNNELSKTERGTGLGLSITKSIIEAHQGRIWVRSREGEGSTFSFAIPIADTGADDHGVSSSGQ